MSTTPYPDQNVALARLEDSIASLRTGLMLVGVIAIAALGVAIYALLSKDAGGSYASDARVSRLEERLSRQLQTPAAGGASSDVSALSDRVGVLERTVKTLASRPSTDATQAVEQLSGRIDALSKDVEQLKQAQTTTP